MTTKYYLKEIPESPVFIMGAPYKFDLLATQDAMLISELDKCAQKGIGGVTALNEQQYQDELKKKQSEELLQSSSKPGVRRQEISALRPSVLRAAASPSSSGVFASRQRPDGGPIMEAASREQRQMPEPIEVPHTSAFRLPPLAKVSDVKAK